MDPHFISSSLSVLQGFIRKDNKEKSLQYVIKFDRLMRLSLENARESSVKLKDEISALESYLKLQELQFEQVFNYCIKAYEGFEEDEIKIPPTLLQPFVENAVIHGIRRQGYKGIISIKIERMDHYLNCIIEDNGIGLNEPETNHRKRSLSTIITKERLEILGRQTGNPASLLIIDRMASGWFWISPL